MPAARAARLHASFGETWTVDEVVAYVRGCGRTTTVKAVQQRRRRGRMLAFRGPDEVWYFPAFQFADGTVREDVTDVLRAMPELDADELADRYAARMAPGISA